MLKYKLYQDPRGRTTGGNAVPPLQAHHEMKDERLKMKNEGCRERRTTCGNDTKWESKFYQNERIKDWYLSRYSPLFCSNFALILFNFSPKAIYMGALRAEILQNRNQNGINITYKHYRLSITD